MIRNGKTFLAQVLIFSLLTGAGSTLTSCSGKKTEETTNASADTTAGMMGRQGDTTGSDPMMNQQAPPDSGSVGAGTPVGSVTVTPKNQ